MSCRLNADEKRHEFTFSAKADNVKLKNMCNFRLSFPLKVFSYYKKRDKSFHLGIHHNDNLKWVLLTGKPLITKITLCEFYVCVNSPCLRTYRKAMSHCSFC